MPSSLWRAAEPQPGLQRVLPTSRGSFYLTVNPPTPGTVMALPLDVCFMMEPVEEGERHNQRDRGSSLTGDSPRRPCGGGETGTGRIPH